MEEEGVGRESVEAWETFDSPLLPGDTQAAADAAAAESSLALRRSLAEGEAKLAGERAKVHSLGRELEV